jgi:hypothetical protein
MLTIKGTPVESLDRMDSDVGKGLARWFTLGHRKGVIEGWLENVRPDGKLTSYCTGGVTNTYRRKHKLVANIPKASDKVVLGKEMRSLFIATLGMILVGHDAAALEARVMAHYTYKYDGGEFGHEILHGDIHSLNAKRFGITRDQAKTLFYAVLYGAQPRKLQNTFGWGTKESQRVFNGFWEENKALGLLRDRVIKVGKKYGYLPGIDGRAIKLRGSEHAWLNALFQSCGAIAMNYSMVFLHENCKELGIPFRQVVYYHDEIASEVPKESVEDFREIAEDSGKMPDKSKLFYSRYGEQAVLSIRQAGTFLNMRCQLDSDYQVGSSWAEIH